MSVKNKAFQFKWSSEQLNLKDFVEYYKARLPLIVKVTEGYCGYGEDKYTYSTEEVYRITNVNTQQRVIARDASQRLLSIPAEYPIKFHVIEKRKQLPATTLKVFFKFNEFQPGIKVIPENGAHMTFWVGADKTMKTDIGTLELVDTYEDLYLVGNVINSTGAMESRTIYIPLFMRLKLVLANGIRNQSDVYFRSVLKHYCDCAENFNNATVKGNPEIMLFDESQKKTLISSSDYIYMEPKTYISCAQVAALRHSAIEPSTNPITINQDTTPKPVIPPPMQSRQSQRLHKPLPPLPDETKSFSWPKNTTPSGNSTESVKKNMLQMKTVPQNRRSRNAEYLEPNRDLNPMKSKNPNATNSNVIDPEWENDDDIQPYRTYCEFTKKVPNTPTQESREPKYFSNINEVPLSLNGVPKKGISDCLKLLHLDSYVQLFNDNDIDGTLLTTMDKDSLVDLGLSKFESHKLYQFKNGWRPKD